MQIGLKSTLKVNNQKLPCLESLSDAREQVEVFSDSYWHKGRSELERDDQGVEKIAMKRCLLDEHNILPSPYTKTTPSKISKVFLTISMKNSC